jgi:hypothetical protein
VDLKEDTTFNSDYSDIYAALDQSASEFPTLCHWLSAILRGFESRASGPFCSGIFGRWENECIRRYGRGLCRWVRTTDGDVEGHDSGVEDIETGPSYTD